jgi:RNA-binding protein
VPELSSRQRAHLRSLSHPLKPVFQIGKDGISEGNVVAIRQAFNNRELLKVRVLDAAPEEAQHMANELADTIGRGTTVVNVRGHVVTLYRSHPERPEIKLPQNGK